MISIPFDSYGNGKLLLTGEYGVLDGAMALAVPTNRGQHFTVSQIEGPPGMIQWDSLDEDYEPWFQGRFIMRSRFVSPDKGDIATRICSILNGGAEMQEDLLDVPAIKIETSLDFPTNWGLGSSSTLIASFAEWLNIDPYELLDNSFGGSGYDVACAMMNSPIFFQIKMGDRRVMPTTIEWPFKDRIFFVHLGKKQDSREGIKLYESLPSSKRSALKNKQTEISQAIQSETDPVQFIAMMHVHEKAVSEALSLEMVQSRLFEDFPGLVKSLGAWGGDFVMAMAIDEAFDTRSYFQSKDYTTILSWEEMVLHG